jgi:hypothetical protein
MTAWIPWTFQPRGFVPVYRTGTLCPGCHRESWIVGRQSAECAFCGAALPLAPIPPAASEAPPPASAFPQARAFEARAALTCRVRR